MLRRLGIAALLLLAAAGVQGARFVHEFAAHGEGHCCHGATSAAFCEMRQGTPLAAAVTAESAVPADPATPQQPETPSRDGTPCSTCELLAVAIAAAPIEDHAPVLIDAAPSLALVTASRTHAIAALAIVRARPPPIL